MLLLFQSSSDREFDAFRGRGKVALSEFHARMTSMNPMHSTRPRRTVPWICLALSAFIFSSGCCACAEAQSRDRYRDARLRMVERFLVQEGITNKRVIAVMQQVPRHEFVKSSLRKQAYLDTALAIGYKQTISPPFIVSYMTESIDPQPSDRVLEIGTGSGYQAAVLSRMVDQVYTIEIVAPLGNSAKRVLKRLGYDNVEVKVGDGYKGWPEKAPFDKIIVTCSPENVPKPLVQQLREGGKMIIPLGQRYQQVFYLLEKRNGRLKSGELIPTLFVPMTGISEQNRRVQPDPANPRVVNGGFENDVNDDERVDNWHYQRQVILVAEGAPEGSRFLRFENKEPGRPSQILQGMPVDGRKVAALTFNLMIQLQDIQAGRMAYERPTLMIHFYDSVRRPVGDVVAGSWIRDSEWHRSLRNIAVPVKAREAVLRLSLNGATGRMDIDDLKLVPKPR